MKILFLSSFLPFDCLVLQFVFCLGSKEKLHFFFLAIKTKGSIWQI